MKKKTKKTQSKNTKQKPYFRQEEAQEDPHVLLDQKKQELIDKLADCLKSNHPYILIIQNKLDNKGTFSAKDKASAKFLLINCLDHLLNG